MESQGCDGRNPCAQQKVRHAIAHLFRGFVRERDGKNGLGGHAVGDQIGHAKRDRARLAGSRAGQDQHRAFDGFHGQPLFGIQFVEKSQHFFVMVGESLHTSC